MFIKNKKSGLVQECSNKDVIKICQRDVENYEVMETLPKPASGKNVENETGQEPSAELGRSLEDMMVVELKALAKERGIDGVSSLNKTDLLAVLKDVE